MDQREELIKHTALLNIQVILHLVETPAVDISLR